MDGLGILIGLGIVVGSTLFLAGAFTARRYAEPRRGGADRPAGRALHGMLWIALAAAGALQVFTSLEVMARVQEKEAEITRRKTMVSVQDKQLLLLHRGLKELQGTVQQVKQAPQVMPAERLPDNVETILNQIRRRERTLR